MYGCCAKLPTDYFVQYPIVQKKLMIRRRSRVVKFKIFVRARLLLVMAWTFEQVIVCCCENVRSQARSRPVERMWHSVILLLVEVSIVSSGNSWKQPATLKLGRRHSLDLLVNLPLPSSRSTPWVMLSAWCTGEVAGKIWNWSLLAVKPVTPPNDTLGKKALAHWLCSLYVSR